MENVNEDVNVIKEKEQKFKSEVYEFLKLYPDAMLKEFISYWTEPNKSKTKMRYELQTTWDLARRLATWSRNDKNFNKDTKQVPAQKTYKSKNFDEFLKDPPDFIKNLTDKKTVKL
jgi:tRNA A37 N6-isopentenylltransferase MiaA